MNNEISITLGENDWGQIIDGLTCRAEQYEVTAKYYEDGSVARAIVEVRDADEARELAQWYRRLSGQSRGQLHAQKN